MINGTILPLCIAAVLVVGSGWYVLRLKLPRSARIALATLRVGLIAVLVLAFLQPTLRFNRIMQPDSRVLVLVDASRSMSLFGPDSIKSVLRRTTEAPGTAAAVWSFGDTLYNKHRTSAIDFKALQSVLPSSLHLDSRTRYRRVLLISDGNWTNTSIPIAAFEPFECGYAVLPAIQPRPFLIASTAGGSVESTPDSSVTITAFLSGYSTVRQPLRIETAGTRSRTLRPATLDSGFFFDTITVRLPPANPGRTLSTLRFFTEKDSTTASCPIVRTVIPDSLIVEMYAPFPDLDTRFLMLALRREGHWRMVRGKSEPFDLLVAGSYDKTADSLIQRLNRGGVVLALGCIPGKTDPRFLPYPDPGIVATNSATYSGIPGSANQQRPPLSAILDSRGREAPSAIQRIISVPLPQPGHAPDTLPLWYQTTYRNHSVVVLAGKGFWRWDFIPQAFEDSVVSGNLFSTAVLSFVHIKIADGYANRFFVYPAEPPLVAGLALPFSVVAPAAIGEPKAASIRTEIKGQGVSIDTAIKLMVSGFSETSIMLPALPAGEYTFQSTLTAGSFTAVCTESCVVEENNAELRVMQQNIGILNQIGRPIPLNDSAITAFLANGRQSVKETVMEPYAIPIRQSWVLLGIIALLFAAEWILRRRLMVD